MRPADSLWILHFEISYLFSAQQSVLIFICDGYFREMNVRLVCAGCPGVLRITLQCRCFCKLSLLDQSKKCSLLSETSSPWGCVDWHTLYPWVSLIPSISLHCPGHRKQTRPLITLISLFPHNSIVLAVLRNVMTLLRLVKLITCLGSYSWKCFCYRM